MSNRDDWDKHWQEYDLTARYNAAQAFRRELLIHWLKEQAPTVKSRFLDIGSGQGDLIASLIKIFPGVEIAGTEISSTGIAQSQAKAPTAHFFHRDLQLAPSPEDPLVNWADFAVCSEVLEHVEHPEQVLSNASHYLAPGARLLVTVPGGPMSAFDRHIGHRQHFDKSSLKQLIDDAGLIPEKISGVGFPFFNLYRMTVILRGKALIKDASAEEEQHFDWKARLAMGAFSRVLKRKLNSASTGWQMIAQARKRA